MKNDTLKQFSEKIASKEPVPGGGGVSAAVGSLAASLASMVCNLTIGKPKYIMYTLELEDIKDEVNIIKDNLLDCINLDAEGFYPLSKAYSMDKTTPGYEEKLEECLRNAASTPMLILRYCCRVIDLCDRLADIGSKLSVSDAGTAVMLAYGALKGAYINIKVNTRLMKDKTYVETLEKEANELVDEYSTLTFKTYDKVLERLA